MKLVWVNAIAVLCMVAACSDNSKETAADVAIKYGIARDACGPIDSPAVQIVLTDKEMSCVDNRKAFNHIEAFFDGFVSGKSIERPFDHGLGKGTADYVRECEADLVNCINIDAISIEIIRETDQLLEGTWEVLNSDRAGHFKLNKCKEAEPVICG